MNDSTLKTMMILISLFQTEMSISQTKYKVHDTLTVLTYTAYFSDLENNTTNEKIVWKSLSVNWEYDKSQTKCEMIYSPTDSVINQLYNPLIKKGKDRGIRITSKSTTGYLDSDIGFWIHPFRSNQYVYTEIAPFPSVYYNKLSVGSKWEEKLIILFGWGIFKGKVKSRYEVVGVESYDYKGKVLEDCWLIKAEAEHSKLGISTINYLFHPNFGFLYMKYHIYNGIEIEFYLIDKK